MAKISGRTGVAPAASEHGKILVAWEFYDRPRYQRGRLWFLTMFVIGLGLLLYAISSANFLFALIIVMFALVLYVSAVHESAPIRFAVTEDGIEVGESFHPYRDVDRFWFFYDPPHVKSLYLDFRGFMRPRLRVDLRDQNPNAIRDILGRYLREDLGQTDEPLSDTISRVIKI